MLSPGFMSPTSLSFSMGGTGKSFVRASSALWNPVNLSWVLTVPSRPTYHLCLNVTPTILPASCVSSQLAGSSVNMGGSCWLLALTASTKALNCPCDFALW